ncbi:MAG TPA: fused MFS/spermidine synthase [Vicinamibacterales bacterium]|nr:fused MFS/spermidine synthase [Vicinamibacterales bacterium]
MTPRRFLPALLLLFVGSGCAALIYEVVWFQLLQLVIGSSAVSMGVLLGTFMGGMCLGSYLLPRYIGRGNHPLRVYAYLELGIAVFGLLILIGMPLLNSVYVTVSGGAGVFGIVMRGMAAAICLLPPTLLMGATLPAISRWVESTPEGVSWLGFFYGGNIAGGVLGSLLAGFYLLRVFDLAVGTFVAIALNVTVALVGMLIAKTAPVVETLTSDREELGVKPVAGAGAVYVAIALSGMTALSSEVIWTRLLSLLFGGTVYTFSLILAVFLFGLGIGSSAGSAIGRATARPRLVFGWCQMLLCAAIAWSAYMLTQSMPYWPINPSITTDPWFNFQLDFVRCLWVVLPGSILWGASFPLALASLASRGQDPARLVGGVYAANTVGAIVGSLCASLLLIVWLGSQHATQLMILISALSGLLVLSTGGTEEPAGRMQFAGTATIIIAAALAGLLSRTVHPIPGIFAAYGRYTATRLGQADVIYMGEGWNATVAVTRLPGGILNYHNAGKVQASSEPQDMRLQRMLGHMTTLIPRQTKKVLVIGCGAGVTAGAVSIDPAVEHQTIAEIEPLVPKVVAKYFGDHNFHVVDNPKVHVTIDDARHFLLTTNEKFDAVTSDPLDPWVKGAAMLYTREFFELVKRKLNAGGAVTLFVQLYESNTEAVKSEIATFMEAFPNGIVWGNTNNGAGYDLVLLGQVEDTKIDVDAIQAKLQRPEYAPMAQSLREIGMNSAIDLFATFAGRAKDLQPWLADAAINRDRNLRLQFLAGMGLNLYQSDVIYSGMLAYAHRFPDELFVASPQTITALRAGILREQGR